MEYIVDAFIMEHERIDNIGFGNLRLIQKPEDFCYGVDAVLLATFAEIKRGTRIIDLGTGTGIIPLILSHKTEDSEIIGVEIQKDSYERGLRNIEINQLSDRVKFINEDVNKLIQNKKVKAHSFDAVFTNPPYVKNSGGVKNKASAKTIARHETVANLEDFIHQASLLLKDRGELYMVHRPNRIVDIIVFCRKYKLEPKQIRFVSPNKETKPNILLIRCVKNGNPDLNYLDPLYVYDEKGEYTEEIMKLYERK